MASELNPDSNSCWRKSVGSVGLIKFLSFDQCCFAMRSETVDLGIWSARRQRGGVGFVSEFEGKGIAVFVQMKRSNWGRAEEKICV